MRAFLAFIFIAAGLIVWLAPIVKDEEACNPEKTATPESDLNPNNKPSSEGR